MSIFSITQSLHDRFFSSSNTIEILTKQICTENFKSIESNCEKWSCKRSIDRFQSFFIFRVRKNTNLDLLYSQCASSTLFGQFLYRSQTRLLWMQYVSEKQSNPHVEYIPKQIRWNFSDLCSIEKFYEFSWSAAWQSSKILILAFLLNDDKQFVNFLYQNNIGCHSLLDNRWRSEGKTDRRSQSIEKKLIKRYSFTRIRVNGDVLRVTQWRRR